MDTVRYKDLLDDVYADLSNQLKFSGDACGIVYCLERTTCDDLSAHLLKNGISSAGNQMKIYFLYFSCLFWLHYSFLLFFFSLPCRIKQ